MTNSVILSVCNWYRKVLHCVCVIGIEKYDIVCV